MTWFVSGVIRAQSQRPDGGSDGAARRFTI